MGMDSVELVLAFEEAFDIEIPDAAAEAMVTVGDVVNHVSAELNRLGRPLEGDGVFVRVRPVTSELLNIPYNSILRSSRFIDDLGVD